MSTDKPFNIRDSIDQVYLSTVGNDECLNSEGWAQWLAARREMFQQKYLLDPEQLVADQRREQSISRDYQGREILELLQNATDAAKASGVPGQVHVELNGSFLIVANTGRPFTVGGVKSLQTPDLSPKHSKNSKYIGSKGLGFRSILNWTRHPIILSGNLSLAYNADYVHQLIHTLAAKHEQINQVLGDAASESDFPVPLLPFPMHLGSSANRNFVEDKVLFARCEALKDKGFDTVVGMPFDRDQGFANALSQVDILRPEFLLFAEGLSELAVIVNDTGKEANEYWHKTWHAEKQPGDTITIVEKDGVSGEQSQQNWRLYTQTGLIDKNLLQDKDDPDNYHLVVAFQKEGLAEPDNLYSFFPTSIPLPVNALCHASLELEQNRKHLQDGAANHFVLARLAEFLAEKIEEQGVVSDDMHLPRKLIAPENLLQGYQADIEPFENAFIADLKHRKVLPTIGGQLVAAAEAITFPFWLGSYNWVPVDIFPNMVMAMDRDTQRFCDLLEVEEIEGKQFVKQLQGAKTLSLEQRASIALGIIDENLGGSFCYQGLLLDTEGNSLDEDDSVYLPGGSLGEGLVFPDWARVKILYEPLWELLQGKRVRDSARALAIFGVQEYALGALISGLVSAANAAAKEQDEYTVRSTLLLSLYQLYKRYDDPEERPAFPKNLTAIVINQTDEWVPAKRAYFGTGYSGVGEIVSVLYTSMREKLIADKNRYLALGVSEEQLFCFLSWLGVAEWPRMLKLREVESKFKEYALPRLDYPAIFSESNRYRFDNYDALPEGCRFWNVRSLDGIDAIVAADSGTILAWLAKDPRASGWLQDDEKNGTLGFVPHGCQNARLYEGELPSYIHWKIKTSPWLSSGVGKPMAPIECMVNDAAITGIFPKPLQPNKEILQEYSISSELLRLAWLNAGVRSSVEDLESEEIYGLMTEFPERDLGGKLIRKLYNWMVKSADFALELDETGENYQAFIDGGKIYASQGDREGYYPVGEAYHVDVEGFPQELLKSLPIVRLPKKRGAEKIRRVFGINVLDKKAVNEQVVHHTVAACTELANQHFQRAKKYIEIFRRSQFAKAPGQALFERLQIRVCEQIKSQITFNEQMLENQLPQWTYSIQGDQLFICCNPQNANEPYHPLLATTLGDAVASIFGLTDGDSFSKIYQCDEESRAELLGKMIGDDLDDDLDAELQRLIDESLGDSESEPMVTLGPVPEPPPLRPPSSMPPVAPQPEISSAPKTPVWNVPAGVTAEPLDHTPKAPGARIDKRVSSGTGAGGSGNGTGSGTSAPKSDGKAGESLAMLFEESQGRFPLYIGHIQGYKAEGADVLSFRNKEERAVFRSGEDQRAALVERVIESKEKWSGGLVKLTDYEVNAAAKWKDKYFIYRFTPIDTVAVEYQLTALSNPLAQLEAVASSIEISLDAATTALKFKLSGNNYNE